MATASKLPIDLIPIPGFCIKTVVVDPAALPPPPRPDRGNLLEPTAPLVVPAGRKVFINICYDKNVPPPPPADEQAIKHAMSLQEHDDDTYYVPVVVSQPRQDKDKVGNPSLVFDCVYNMTLKSRTLKDSEFKVFLVELALQRIEAQTSLVLSRQIGTPNIVAKGKLEPRRVWVPTWLATGQHVSGKPEGDAKEKNALIQEVDPSGGEDRQNEEESAPALPRLKGTLKHSEASKSIAADTKNADGKISVTLQPVTQTPQRPAWSWRKEGDERLIVTISVSKETPYDAIRSAALDIEPRRLVLRVPGSATLSPLELDVDLSKSDAEIVATVPGVTAAGFHGTSEDDSMKEPNSTLLLKRQRDFNVDLASAEWRVAEGRLLVYV